jgi:hypothetical protein
MLTAILTVMSAQGLITSVRAVPDTATAGGFSFGNPEEIPGFVAALRTADRVIMLAEPSQAGGNEKIIGQLLTRNIPGPGDRDVTDTAKPLLNAILQKLESYDPKERPYSRLFGITSAVAFTGQSARVVLLICAPCRTAVLVRSAGDKTNSVAQSPQFSVASLVSLLPP